MKSLTEGRCFLYSSFNSAARLPSSSKRLKVANVSKHKPVMTPLKSRPSASSLSVTRSKSKSQSRAKNKGKLLRPDSTSGLSTNSKNVERYSLQKWVKQSLSRKQSGARRSFSRHSQLSKSGKSTARSANSNPAKKASERMKRE